ncbi:MAG: hypothetical protein MAG795_01229 [Candidatus Woesearchaeota archaeon]|nr:hypothetical protein [Candidatus Woesearchaeota archaeon]
MATVFDIGLLESFSPIFTFIFVFAAMFGILQVVKIFGDKSQNLNSIIALCIAIFITFADKPRLMIRGMIPWFAMLFVFGMFLIMAMRFIFGDIGDEMFLEMLGGKPGAGWWVLVGAILILVVGVSSVLGPEITPGSNTTTPVPVGSSGSGSTSTGDWRTNVLNTLYHPKLLGAVLLLVIALFTILLISKVPK